MKKIALLISLMLCLTISGVYATWSYSGDEDIIDKRIEVVPLLADPVASGAHGVFTIESNINLVIDQLDTEHNAYLKYETNDGSAPYLRVTFTPSDAATVDIKNNAVPAELYFTTTTNMMVPCDTDGHYDANGTLKDIFVLSNPSNQQFDANIAWGEPDANGKFTVTYSEAQSKEMIKLNTPIMLDTKVDHTAFNNLLNGNIRIMITDGTVDGGSEG